MLQNRHPEPENRVVWPDIRDNLWLRLRKIEWPLLSAIQPFVCGSPMSAMGNKQPDEIDKIL